MGPEPHAMTPEQATEAIASVRDYRQGLTARAAGLVWMVWGLALAILASADMVGILNLDEESMVEGEGWIWPGLISVLMPLAALAAGAIITNAIWKAHALERGAHHRSWVAWLGIIGILAAGVAIGFLSITLAQEFLNEPGAPSTTYILVMPLVAAVAAGLIAVLQRRRVKSLPGILAALALVGVEFLLPVLTHGTLEEKILQGVQTTMFAIFTVFVATGLWYYKRG